MPSLKFFSFIAIAAGLLLAGAAPAQTVAALSPVSGNGQLRCPTCPYATTFGFFEPLQLVATDASGNPVPNVSVAWSGPSNIILMYTQTVTDQNGLTQNTIFPGTTVTGPTYQQSSITASAGAVSLNFTETQSLGGQFTVIPTLVSPAVASSFTGAAGTQGSPVIQIHVANPYSAIAGVSVRLVNISGSTPAMTCVTGAGADPGSVLTDSSGNASCTPLFGSMVGNGQTVVALVGGVASSLLNGGLASGYWATPSFFVNVTPTAPGLVTKVSGDNQSANPGQSLVSALQVRVSDAAGVAAIGGVGLTWTVTPAGAATLGSTSTSTDASGLSRNTVALAAGAVGQFQVKAALSATPAVSTTFSVTAYATVTGLTKASGDGQSAVVSAAFAQPLVVQVNGSNGQALGSYPVTFSVSGPASLSATSATTDFNGRAQVTVTAGASTGAVAVMATVGGFSQTFNLTVVPVGPRITSFTNGAQFYSSYDANHSALSPCGIATAYGTGIAPTLQGTASISNWFTPLPYALAGVKIAFNNSQAPIYNVANTNGVESVTFQVPCDVTPGAAVPVTVQANGGTANLTAIVRAAGPGIFEWTQPDGVVRAVLEKADGSYVTPDNPARGGDTLRMYATGLGATIPAVAGTDSLPPVGVDALVSGQVIVGVNNQGAQFVAAKLSPDLIGVYVVDFKIPTYNNTPQGNNIILSLAVNAIDGSPTQFSGGSKVPFKP